MAKSLLLILLCCLMFPFALASSSSPNALDVLLNSTSISERKAAFLDIAKNSVAHAARILDGLVHWKETKDQRFAALNKLIYLAAVLKRDEFINPLLNIADNPEYTKYQCIYNCPVILALEVFAVSNRWAPTDQIIAKLPQLQFYGQISLLWRHSGIQFARPEDQELLSKTETLSEEELIRKAGPFNSDYKTRWLAAEVLSNTVADDKNLLNLYWLAIEEVWDASCQYRCSIYKAILRAEKARTLKGR
jgi:hypothetical protein